MLCLYLLKQTRFWGAMNAELKKYLIICGHYGCGKTNLSLNLALSMAGKGEAVTLVDLDIVNPYFRSSDYLSLLEERGVRLIAPRYSRSTLDIPALPAEIAATFEMPGRVILDVGGDDAGATALGRFSRYIGELDYDMLYVVNKNRPLTGDSEHAAALLGEIQTASRLKATGVANNTHLMGETTEETVLAGIPFAEETARQLGLPLRFTTAPRAIAEKLGREDIFPVDIHVKTPWM